MNVEKLIRDVEFGKKRTTMSIEEKEQLFPIHSIVAIRNIWKENDSSQDRIAIVMGYTGKTGDTCLPNIIVLYLDTGKMGSISIGWFREILITKEALEALRKYKKVMQ
jgi:hypothetical protein